MAGSSTDPDDHERSKPGFFMSSTIKSLAMKFPSVQNISTMELSSWLRSPTERSVVILDTRPEEEYVVSHIASAQRVDWDTQDVDVLVQRLEEQLKGKPQPTVVCYCSLGYRSSTVVKNLQQHYAQSGKLSPELYNLAGSLFQWANEERPMVNGRGETTHFAHPYTAFWGKLLNQQHRRKSL